MVLSPSTLPATVSIRWPHSSAVTPPGAVGASAATLKPTDRRTADPAQKHRAAVVRFNTEESRIFIVIHVVGDLGAAFQHTAAHRSIRQSRNVIRYCQRCGQTRRFH